MARRDISMSDAEVLQFLSEPKTIHIATQGPDGFPHLAPMWYLMVDGKVAFRSFTKSQKIVNLRRDPKLTVLAEAGTGYDQLRGVMIKGEARLVEDPATILDWYGELTARYSFQGSGPRRLEGEELEAAFGRFASKNTGVIVEPVRVISWDHRKLGGAY